MSSGSPDRPDESPAYRALAEQSATYLNRYIDVFVPLENKYIQTVFDSLSDEAYTDARGRAENIAQSTFDRNVGRFEADMLASGVDPSSGKFKGGLADRYESLGRVRGLAGADAGIGNTDRGLAGVMGLVKQGQGLANEAMAGQAALAQTAEDKVRSQFATDFADSQQASQAAGVAAGMGAGGLYSYFQPKKSGGGI